jgi:hypothetical protein
LDSVIGIYQNVPEYPPALLGGLEFGHLSKYFLLDRYTPYMVSYLL